MTVSEKLKTMEQLEVAQFYQKVFTEEDYFLDNYFCEMCKKRHDGCITKDSSCLSDSINLIQWFLEQPYDDVVQRLENL